MAEPIGPTVIDTTRPIIRVAENPPIQTESGRRDPSAEREIGGGREEERVRKAELLGQISKEKGAREVLKAAAANKTGLTPPKEQGEVTHDVILNQLKNAGETKDWDIARMDISGKLDKSFGWEPEGVEGEEKFKLDQDALKRKEKTAKAVDGAAKYVEKSFDGLSPVEQKNIIDKVRAGLSGIEVYDAICKADADGGKERIASILKDDALRNEVELKLSLVLREAANKQEILAEDVNTAKETLEIKKGEPDIIDKQIELKNKELELNKKNQKDYETVDGVKGSKVLEREEIGPVDTVLIEGNNKRIEEVNKEVIKIDEKINGFKTEDAENSRKIDRQKVGIRDNEANIKQLQDSIKYYEDQKLTEKDPTRLSTLDTMIKDRNGDIKKLERDNFTSQSIIDKCQESIEKNKENIENSTSEKNSHLSEIGFLKAENEPEEKKRDLLKNIDDQHKKLIEDEKKIAQELSDLKIGKIEKGQETEAAEQILNGLINKKAKAEEGIQGDVESVYRNAVIDYLTEKVRESQTAERTLEAEKEKNDQTWMDFNDSLDDEWFKKDERNDKWLGKKFNTAKIDIKKINNDFGDIVSGESKPDDIVKRILKDKCGLTDEEAEKKLLEPEFGEKMKGKVIKRLMENKLMVGQLTGSEIFKLVSNTDWGKDALDKAVAANDQLKKHFDKAREQGIIKGSDKQEWMKQIQEADKHDSNKRWTTGILAALMAALLGGAYFGGGEILKNIT